MGIGEENQAVKVPVKSRRCENLKDRVHRAVFLDIATKAIPQEGVYQDGAPAETKISNKGRIYGKALKQSLIDETRGRGLGIVNRLVSNMGGNLAVEVGDKTTTFRINLPLYQQ